MKKKEKQPSFFSLLILGVIGLYFICVGFSPIEIKIEQFNNISTGKIHRKSMLPPFNKDIYVVVSNLKCAVITTSKSSKGRTTYRVELESFDGTRAPVTPYYSSGYNSKQKLQDKLNKSIMNKKEITYTIRQYGIFMFGLIFCLVLLVIVILSLKKRKSTLNHPRQNKPKQYSQQEIPQSEAERYKSINDLIIK